MEDERKGCPSASGMQRYALCAGSWPLEQSLSIPEFTSEWAESGTRIHDYVRLGLRGTDESAKLKDDAERETGSAILEQTKVLIEDAITHWADGGRPTEYTEVRLWDTPLSSITGGKTYSGKFDLMLIDSSGQRAILIDYKSGWGEVPPADQNLQMRCYAALARINYNVRSIIVAIVQPNKGKPSVAHYSETDLVESVKWIRATISACHEPGAPRKAAAAACKYCNAKSKCPEATEVLMNLATGVIPSDFASALEQTEIAKLVIKDIEQRAKAELEKDPACIPGWHLKPGNTRRTAPEVTNVQQRVVDLLPLEKFLPCCTVAIGKLEKAYSKSAGLKGETGKKALESRLGELIVKKQNAPTLARVGAEDEEGEE